MGEQASGRLSGKVAVVVGAGTLGEGWGIGKATSVVLAREGAAVACLDRDGDAAEATAAMIRAEGGRAQSFAADATDAAAIAAALAAVETEMGPIDVLDYNVGIVSTAATEDMAESEWRRVMDVNVGGLFNTVRAVLPRMLARRRGTLIAIASIAGIRWIGIPYVGYSASKAAMIQFMRHVALEHAADGIRAVSVLPGLMETPLVRASLTGAYGGDTEAMLERRHALCPTGRMGDAFDVAHAVAFLASDQARYITGTELVVDGGLTARCTTA